MYAPAPNASAFLKFFFENGFFEMLLFGLCGFDLIGFFQFVGLQRDPLDPLAGLVLDDESEVVEDDDFRFFGDGFPFIPVMSLSSNTTITINVIKRIVLVIFEKV